MFWRHCTNLLQAGRTQALRSHEHFPNRPATRATTEDTVDILLACASMTLYKNMGFSPVSGKKLPTTWTAAKPNLQSPLCRRLLEGCRCRVTGGGTSAKLSLE